MFVRHIFEHDDERSPLCAYNQNTDKIRSINFDSEFP